MSAGTKALNFFHKNNFAISVLKLVHKEDEKQRMELRDQLRRAAAEAEDLTRTLADCCHVKANGAGDR